MNECILSTKKINKNFGALSALKEVEVTVQAGQIHGLIGPNGAGKTTFVNVVTGCLPASDGECHYAGENITNSDPHVIARMRLTRTFQQGQILPKMTCLQNVMAGRHRMIKTGILRTLIRPPFVRSEEENETEKRAMELLELVGLADSAEKWAADLNWIECQLLQIARALASEPKLLILDEPSAGMGYEESRRVGQIIKQVRNMGVTIILISHDMKLVMDVADWITVLNFGQKIFTGPTAEAQSNPDVLEAYLGEE